MIVQKDYIEERTVTQEQRNEVVSVIARTTVARLSAVTSLVREIRHTSDLPDSWCNALHKASDILEQAKDCLACVRITMDFSRDNGTVIRFFSLIDKAYAVFEDKAFNTSPLLCNTCTWLLSEIKQARGAVNSYIDYAEGKGLTAIEYCSVEEHFNKFADLSEQATIQHEIASGIENLQKGVKEVLLLKRKLKSAVVHGKDIDVNRLLSDLDGVLEALVLDEE